MGEDPAQWSVARKLRFWLIKKLVGKSLVVMNATMHVQPGWELHKNAPDQCGLICNNAFRGPRSPSIDQTRIMSYDGEA